MPKAGCVILDVGCFKYLESDEVYHRVKASINSVNLQIWPTALNCLEAATAANPHIRKRLLGVLRSLAGNSPLLPDPHDLLRQNATATLAGDPGFTCKPSGLEWLLEEDATLSDEDIAKARTLIEEADSYLSEAHVAGRKRVQEMINDLELRDRWPTAGEFLDEQWSTVEQLYVYLDGAWERLGLGQPPAPREQLLRNPAWRLHMDGFGVSVYRGVIAREQGKLVQHSDLQQLVYMGAAAIDGFSSPLTSRS
jgi:hypothetical protein